MLDRLWYQLHARFKVVAMRSARLCVGHVAYNTFTDDDCATFEDAYLMGGEL